MDRYVNWKLQKRRERFWRRVGITMGFAFGTPVLIGALAWTWRFAIVSVL